MPRSGGGKCSTRLTSWVSVDGSRCRRRRKQPSLRYGLENPTRRVGGGRDNVSGRYPSRKMGLTIQFQSHGVELPLVYEMEHDPGVLEYYDQPPSIPLA